MTGKRQFEAAAERGAVDRGDPRLAACLDTAIKQRKLSALLEKLGGRRRLALRGNEFGKGPAEHFEHGQIGAGAERILARRNDDALDGFVGRELRDEGRKLIHDRWVYDVHRAPWLVPGHERNPVAVDLDSEVGEAHRL